MKDINIIYESVGGLEHSFYSVSTYSMPRQELKFLHYHEVLELGLCLAGSGICHTDVGEAPYSKGDAQIILPYQPHYDVTDGEDTLWIFISIDVMKMSSSHVTTDAAYFTELVRRLDVSGVFSQSEHPELHRRIKDIAELFQSGGGDGIAFSDILSVRCAELLLFLSSIGDIKREDTGGYKKNRSILPALNYVSESLKQGQRPTVSGMADSCFMSESYFRKVFRSATGESPKDYAVRMQTRAAADLLAATDLTLPEIYTRCGFEDSSTFYRCFVRVHGTSPGEYRRKCK